MIEIGSVIALLEGLDTVAGAVENFKKITTIFRGDKDRNLAVLEEIAKNTGNLAKNLEIVKFGERIIYVPNYNGVHDTSLITQRRVEDIQEVRGSLEQLQQALNTNILSSALILTPEKMQHAMVKNPWRLFDRMQPLSLAEPHHDPDMAPVLFEWETARYLGWIKRGLLPVVFDCELDTLAVPPTTIKTADTPEELQKLRQIAEQLQREKAAKEQAELERLRRQQEHAAQTAAEQRRLQAERVAEQQRLQAEIERLKQETQGSHNKFTESQIKLEELRARNEALLCLKKQEAERRQQEADLAQQLRAEQARQAVIQRRFRLSAWNPLDWGQLLWWTLVMPQHLNAYTSIHGQAELQKVGAWLVSTMIWLPLFLLILGAAFNLLPVSGHVSLQWFRMIGGIVSIAWLLTGIFGHLDEDIASFVAFGVVGFVAGSVAFGVAFGVTGFVAGSVAIGVVGVVAFGVAISVVDGVVDGVGGVVAFGVVGGVAIGVVGGVTGIVAIGVAGVAVGVVASVVAGVVMFFILLFIAEPMSKNIKKSIENNQPSLIARSLFVLLVVDYAFLIWLLFLGGWKGFQ